MRKINKIVIHCTDSDDSLDIGAKQINEWHLARGFTMIGYHFVIRRNGKIEIGRFLDEVGAHVKGHNQRSIGICWVGRNQIDKKQYEMLKQLVSELQREYGLRVEDVLGHYELDHGKTCPNLDMLKVRADILFTGKDKITDYVKERVRTSKDAKK